MHNKAGLQVHAASQRDSHRWSKWDTKEHIIWFPLVWMGRGATEWSMMVASGVPGTFLIWVLSTQVCWVSESWALHCSMCTFPCFIGILKIFYILYKKGSVKEREKLIFGPNGILFWQSASNLFFIHLSNQISDLALIAPSCLDRLAFPIHPNLNFSAPDHPPSHLRVPLCSSLSWPISRRIFFKANLQGKVG